MSHAIPVRLALLAVLGTSCAGALACSESMFTNGRGLPYQVYMAPHPAAVLVYAESHDARDARDTRLSGGLTRAGHQVRVVNDAQTLAQALDNDHYDVVIAPYAQVDVLSQRTDNSGPTPAVIPVVARSERKLAADQDRFQTILVEGASVGQYLRAINRALAATAS